MGVRLTGRLKVLTLAVAATAVASVVWADGATAQETTPPSDDTITVQEAFQRAFYANDRNFYENRSLYRQVNWILGQGSIVQNGFTDNEIARDGRAVDRLYRQLLLQQVATDPVMRTSDLANPFNTSYQLLPSASASSFSTDTEVVPAMPAPVSTFTPPPAPTPVEVSPIPALY